MKVWWTARQLAWAALPGLPNSERHIKRVATEANWTSQSRPGRGGGREYHVSSLPAAAQRALARAAAKEQAAGDPRQVPAYARTGGDDGVAVIERRRPQRLDELRPQAAGLAIAREKVVAYTLELAASRGKIEAIRLVAADAAAGRLPEELQIYAGMANGRSGTAMSASTLRRWVDAYVRGGEATTALAARDDKMAVPPLWLYPLLKLYARPTKPPVALCHEQLEPYLPEGVPMPSLRAAQRAIASLPAVEKHRGRMGPRMLKTLRPYVIRDFTDLMPADVYTADGHCHDQEVLHPKTGRPHRPEIVSILDVASRRCVGWAAGHAESAPLIADGLRRACRIAVPAIWYVDRGTGFAAGAMTDPDIGLMDRLGIRRETSLPYNSQARGVIERFHQSCWIRGAKAAPGYMGQAMDPEARQLVHKRSRRDLKAGGTTAVLMGWEVFVAWAAAQVAAYNARPHSSLPRVRDEAGRLRHLTPDEAWATKAGEAELMPLAEHELNTLFMPVELRQCRRGAIDLHNHTYFAAELEWSHDQTVQVAYDAHDPSRVWVRDDQGRFLCEAVRDANKRPYFPAETVAEARERRRQQGQIRRLDAKREAIEGDAPVRRAITYLRPELTDEQKAAQAQLEAELLGPKPAPPEPSVERLPEDSAGRYRLWLALDARAADGGDLSEREAIWHRMYAASAEWRSARDMAAYTAEFEELCARKAAAARAMWSGKEDARG